jgi:hypothetical protein
LKDIEFEMLSRHTERYQVVEWMYETTLWGWRCKFKGHQVGAEVLKRMGKAELPMQMEREWSEDLLSQSDSPYCLST